MNSNYFFLVLLLLISRYTRFTTAPSHDHDCNLKVHDSRPRLHEILNKYPSIAPFDEFMFYVLLGARGPNEQSSVGTPAVGPESHEAGGPRV